MDTSQEIDVTNSSLIMDGDEKLQKEWSKKISDRVDYLKSDQEERKRIYKIRDDFYTGNHQKYSNIVGLNRKEKKGHANSVLNYAGKTTQKIAQTLSNSPPHITFPIDYVYKPDNPNYEIEEIRTQSVEDAVDETFRVNKFWRRGYRRGAFNQSVKGDFAVKVYPFKDENDEWSIKIVGQEKMENLMVGWRGDDAKEYDYVICEELRSIQSIEEEWGIKVPSARAVTQDTQSGSTTSSSHNNNNEWGMKQANTGGSMLPSGQNNVPSVYVLEYDDENVYAIKVDGKLVQLVIKDGITYPKMKFWYIGENIPKTGSHWSIADIDYIIDPNIELNEASNEERDYIRVGANQKYVAYNMDDFDPESVKTGSGGVISISSPDNSARFEPLQTNVNTYPADTYLTRMKKHLHDLGVPEVTFGSAGTDSGRSKALDYQSLVDLIEFKQDSWELVLDDVIVAIQKLLYFYYKHEFLTDAETGKFKARLPEYDWADIVPTTKSDQIVNVVNKVQMGLPFKIAYKELGYRDVDSIIEEMKKEAKDDELMLYRAKKFQYSKGIVDAQMEATKATSAMGGGMGGEGDMGGMAGGDVNAQNAAPTLTTSQNDSGAKPMSVRGGTTSFSSAKGLIDATQQNLQAQGR